MGLNDTPSSERLHILVAGRTNSGKSSLVNALTGQQVALVSDVAGTTTDPVYKAMEIMSLGPCVIMDTAGFDDTSELGARRVEQTMKAVEKADIAIMVCTGSDISEELRWSDMLKEKNVPVLWVLNKTDMMEAPEAVADAVAAQCGSRPVLVSAETRSGIDGLIALLGRLKDDTEAENSILGSLVRENDLVLLVMPQDRQAPKGRLILPQVQTIRELLDRSCVTVCCTLDTMEAALQKLSSVPDLIVTDSQVFDAVYAMKPAGSRLTSFSVLFARYKGDMAYFVESARTISSLTEDSRVLIAEACTHAPASEDIGRVKIPAMLRKKVEQGLKIDVVSGSDFPEDLSGYSLVIHCGACMFNRKHVLNRVARAKKQNVPMTNYGVTIAYVKGILDKVDY